uniref:Initiator tRNA phosphoribosyl transferase family protein n=1 Tax=Erodium chrysanthum TaxID=337364 RepID=A0A0G4AN93_9ROSI|nr:initiator tRNA phosphoribosyl transferase family protein [Erodium chrysanthum]
MEEEARLSIYRAARTIKRRENTLYNALRSIYDDSIFVGEIAQLWPELPLVANLRCGLWYSPKFHSTCYFKSTDGHTGNWSFNTSRLNLHVAHLAGQKGGCIVVDSTRKGKRFPDSMSKTIPIWTCVFNRAIANHRRRMQDNIKLINEEPNMPDERSHEWDSSLHLPLWVSKTEKASIETRLEEWTKDLEVSGVDIASLSSSLKKPLRPLWISQKTVIWLNEVPDHDSWDFTPIILVSASSSTGLIQHRSSEFSWNYIPGAGDDEESWARGLSPELFWNNVYDVINSGPDVCNQKVANMVEKDRVYRAQRGQNAPQITVKPQKSIDSSCVESALSLDGLDVKNGIQFSEADSTVYWLGTTNIAVGSALAAANTTSVDCILNCGLNSISVDHLKPKAYLHLPTLTSKFDRFSLRNNLAPAVNFAKLNLSNGNRLLVCCHDGEDISVCVCLAVLTALFHEGGTFDDGKSFSETHITKLDMRRRLVFLCEFATKARPSRGNLKQVFSFVSEGGDSLLSRYPE